MLAKFWWPNQEPSICSMSRVQIHLTNNAILMKITGWKVNWLRHYMIKACSIYIYQTKCNTVLCTLEKHFYFHFAKILSFYKLICTQLWNQISGGRMDHYRQWALFSGSYLWRVFHICCVIEAIRNILKFSKLQTFEVKAIFSLQVSSEVEYNIPISKYISYILSFWLQLIY